MKTFRLLSKYQPTNAPLWRQSPSIPVSYYSHSSLFHLLIVGLQQGSGVAVGDLRVRPEAADTQNCAVIEGERIGGIWDNECVATVDTKQP